MTMNRLANGNEGCLDRQARLIINHNFSDVSLCTTQLDVVSSTALVNVTGMATGTLIPGATYKFKATLPTVCTANNGSKFAFKQGAASMISAIEYEAKAFTASGVAVSRGTTATDQALILDNAAAVVILAEITGVVTLASTQAMFDAEKNGTLNLTLQAAEHTSHSDTFSVFKNAQMQFEQITTS